MHTSGIAKLSALTAVVGGVWGHAAVKEPIPRIVLTKHNYYQTGPTQVALCGEAVTKVLERDLAGPIENAIQVAAEDYGCNAYLCRGYQYEDNTDNVKVFQPGDVISFNIDLVAGHRPGYANISVVDLATNEAIGDPLKTWDDWPITDPDETRDDVNFNITIPDTLGSACDEGGKCAMQWYWYSMSNYQTYENCIDFFVEG